MAMAARRGPTPIACLLCTLLLLAATLAIFFIFQERLICPLSSSSSSFPSSSSSSLAEVFGSDKLQRFQLIIKVLTFDRLPSLSRCLASLAAAEYQGETVKLHIFIDHFTFQEQPFLHKKGNGTEVRSTKASVYVDAQLREAHEMLSYVDSFNWSHGPKEVHYRTHNAGLQRQWIEAWWPASEHEFAFIVEDDMRLSPLYYKYLKKIVETYYYDNSNYDPSVYGISLQRPRFVPGKKGNALKVENSTRLFLYQMVGTWGQLLFPKPWKEFRLWYDLHKSQGMKPLLEGMVTTGWYKRLGEKIWTPWFTKYVHSRGYFNLYTNFLQGRALSVSYRDKGVNVKKAAGPDSELIDGIGLPDIDMWEMMPLKSLKRYDYCFEEVSQKRFVASLDELKQMLPSLQDEGEIVLVNTLGFSEGIIKNWLCHFSKVGLKNTLILSDNFALVEDLSRRGNAVMHLDSSREIKVIRVEMLEKLVLRNLASALTTLKALECILQLGYDIWHTRVDTLWLGNPLSHSGEVDVDVLGMKNGDLLMSGYMHLKGNKKTTHLMNVVRKQIMEDINNGQNPKSFPTHQDVFDFYLLHCLPKAHIEMKSLSPGLMTVLPAIAPLKVDIYQSSPLLSGTPSSNLLISKESLDVLGLWVVDDELTCTRVFCHSKQKM